MRLVVLGSGFAVASEEARNTQLAVLGSEHGILFDCGISPLDRFRRFRIDPELIGDVVITHFHPDHAAGLSSFLMGLWLQGRKRPLTVHASPPCLDRVEKLMELFEWRRWSGFYPLRFEALPKAPGQIGFENPEFVVRSAPVRHWIPAQALRIESRTERAVVVYSSDTGPFEELVTLSGGADLLLHEATGLESGHSSAEQAGAIADQSGVKRLAHPLRPLGGPQGSPCPRSANFLGSGGGRGGWDGAGALAGGGQITPINQTGKKRLWYNPLGKGREKASR
ncbi:MAG: MBL fold metallo-hydrolase [Anaerolineales bacterium]